MKKIISFLIITAMFLLVAGCGNQINIDEAVKITLSDEGMTSMEADGVEITKDIVYYEAGHDFTYGEGDEKDAHTPEEAAAHTVVKITKPGTYSVSGKLSKGQIAIDLGEDAKDNKDAVVNLVLNGVDISCDVAPAIIFYSVYECGNTDEESATNDVNTTHAGANLLIADDTVNNVNGSYVARIYKADSVKLSADGKKVEDAKKLHKYDGAVYSKMSMNVFGGKTGNGILNINAENEGLDTELHLTVNGGNININSGNDGINTNEDNVSVTTINGGNITIKVNGATGEGDGIDSNGWLVINGGRVIAEACSFSADAGIDSDRGIHINGGTVFAYGSMLDRIEDGGQTYATFSFAEKQKGGVTALTLRDASGNDIFSTTPSNDYSMFIYSSSDLKEGNYTLWSGDNQLAGAASMMFGGGRPDRGERPEMGGDFDPEKMKPENFDPENMPKDFDRGNMPENFDRGNMPKDFDPDKMPEDFKGARPDGAPADRPKGQGGRPDFSSVQTPNVGTSTIFEIKKGANMFSFIEIAKQKA